ncbi:MAG: T9SS type A sorting domain-containing protein [Candidatus Kapabacteria bacterium]|nr:T9SS type A sorting domain-containing protein [Candidatus Kapabacteria bacterium]
MKKYFVLIVLLIAFYLPSHAELADTIWTHQVPGEITSVKFSLDGKYIYAGSNQNIIAKIEVATNQTIKTYTTENTHLQNFRSMDLSKDGKFLLVASDTVLILMDAETGEYIRNYELPVNQGQNSYESKGIASVSLSYNNKYCGVVLTGVHQLTPKFLPLGSVICWELETGKLALNMVEGTFLASYFSFSPTENNFVVGYVSPNQNNKVPINLFEVGSWKLLKQFEGHTFSMKGLKFSKDGNYLASWGDRDDIVKIWDVKNKALKQNINNDKHLIYGVQDIGFLSNNSIIISAENLINSKLSFEFILLNLDKQNKSTISFIPEEYTRAILDVYTANNKNNLLTANLGILTLLNLDKTLDVQTDNNQPPIVLFPNPTTKELIITLPEVNNILVNYRIINSSGNEVMKRSITIQNNTMNINVSSLVRGSYILNLNTNNIIKSFNFIIQ